MGNNKHKILLVEDDLCIQSVMTTLLEAADYQVVVA